MSNAREGIARDLHALSARAVASHYQASGVLPDASSLESDSELAARGAVSGMIYERGEILRLLLGSASLEDAIQGVLARGGQG